MKSLEEMSYEELVEYITSQLMYGLIEGGGKELKVRVHLWLGQAIKWSEKHTCKKER